MKGKKDAIISFKIKGASPICGGGFGIETKDKYKIIKTVGTPNMILVILKILLGLKLTEIVFLFFVLLKIYVGEAPPC